MHSQLMQFKNTKYKLQYKEKYKTFPYKSDDKTMAEKLENKNESFANSSDDWESSDEY